ncbi:MAG: hypothetical protein ABR969_06610 [Sedimentisphaerales bacterium]|jgi:hypothetical protein
MKGLKDKENLSAIAFLSVCSPLGAKTDGDGGSAKIREIRGFKKTQKQGQNILKSEQNKGKKSKKMKKNQNLY